MFINLLSIKKINEKPIYYFFFHLEKIKYFDFFYLTKKNIISHKKIEKQQIVLGKKLKKQTPFDLLILSISPYTYIHLFY